MLRWTETRDGYRVTRWPAGCLFFLIVVSTGATAGAVYYAQAEGGTRSLVLGGVALLACAIIAFLWRGAPWLEMPVHGGPIVWGLGTYREGRTELRVSHFEVEATLSPQGVPASPGPFATYDLVACLEDGRRCARLGAWQADNPAALACVARELNEHIGASPSTPPDLSALIRRHRTRVWSCVVLVVILLSCTLLAFFFVLVAIAPRFVE